ncbi:MAG TPA: isoprenylcysteine carboxylmethyltransferase family protein [Gemmatimonadales bacterium]|nr:isoprenylcysteine carboxylmethyltransferase family protein [Gemmatimonadales bacterium]
MTAQPPDKSGVRFPPPLIYLGLFLAGYAIQWLVPFSIFPEAGWLDWVGGLLFGGGVGLALVAAGTFRSAGTSVNPTKPATALVTHGPFAFSRNPMYLAMVMIYLGLIVVVNSLWPLLLLPVAVWLIRTRVIALEEAYLQRKFGQLYSDYQKQVRRWL